MSRHEIDIEGLPEGYEPVKATYIGATLGKTETHSLMLEMRRKVRKYDHSKTDDDVLVRWKGRAGCYPKVTLADEAVGEIPPYWQPNIHGKCPVDGDACIVRVRLANGIEIEDVANKITWEIRIGYDDVVRWQFIRLADGYEW